MAEYRIIFRGKFVAQIPQPEIRRRLLELYKNNQETVNLFFRGRPLVVRKHLDYPKAQRYRAVLEKAGVPCEIVEEPATPPVREEQNTPSARPRVPEKETLPSGGPYSGTRQTEATASPKNAPSPPAQSATGPSGGSLFRGSRLQNISAVIMIAAIIFSAGIRIWALQNAGAIHPPDHVTANESEVCVHFNGTLFFLAPDGHLRKRIPLPGLGIRREPAGLQLLRNGDFLIGNLEKGEIVRCERSPLACRRIGPAGQYTINENFKFLADEERNLLFISDTNNHALLVQGLDGSALQKIAATSVIRFPNGMALDKEGRLWLSNTAEKEVLSFEFRDGRFVQTDSIVPLRPQTEESREMEEFLKKKPAAGEAGLKVLLEKMRELQKVREKLGDDLLHSRPLAISWDAGGNLWVAASNARISSAGLGVFDAAGKQITRIPLGEGAIPVDVTTNGDRVLIADSGLFQFLSVSSEAPRPVAFGDEVFQREVSQVRGELRRFEAIRAWAGRSIWLLSLGTLVLAVFIAAGNYRRRRRASLRAGLPARSPAPSALTAAGVQQDPGIRRHYCLEFSGTGSEYFRIWIVNVFLTILTLGIYAPWAKVRSRRYFYRNTVLAGHPFDYTADPLALLKGYAIVGAGMLLYSVTKYFNPSYALVVFGIFSLLFPLLVYKSLRFFAHNSTYRNIRFRFLGSLGESYRTYLLYPVLIPFTLGLIVPYWEFRRKRYFYNNIDYGATPNTFSGTHGPFYTVYIKAGIVMALLAFGTVLSAALVLPKLAGASLSGREGLGSGFLLGALLSYGVVLFAASFFQMYLYAWTTNYCLGHSELGEVRFESTLSGGRLFWIRVSNIIAIVFSVGLLTPWAKVRRMKYVADNLFVITSRDLSDFASASTVEQSSYGDAATEYLGFEIGL